MLKRLKLILLLSMMMANIIPAVDQNPGALKRTIKQIIPVDKATEPYFAIQILALKEAPNDASFFENINSAREFSCVDGYKRYVVGRYNSREEAVKELQSVRSKGPRYANSFIVNTANFSISSSFSSEYMGEGDEKMTKEKLSGLRTFKKIIPVDKATQPPYAIQILALKNPPQDPNFFENVDAAREFNCADGFARYVVGQYESSDAARPDLSKVRSLGTKYKNAFIVNTFDFKISSSFRSQFGENEPYEEMDIKALRTRKRIIPVDQLKPGMYAVQVLALKETPKDAAFFEKLNVVREVSCTDGFKRYLVGEYADPEVARERCKEIREIGKKYKNAFIVQQDRIPIDKSAFSAEYNPSNSSQTYETSMVEVDNAVVDDDQIVMTYDEKDNTYRNEQDVEKSPDANVSNVQNVNDNIAYEQYEDDQQDEPASLGERIKEANNDVLQSGGNIEFNPEGISKEEDNKTTDNENLAYNDNASINTNANQQEEFYTLDNLKDDAINTTNNADDKADNQQKEYYNTLDDLKNGESNNEKNVVSTSVNEDIENSNISQEDIEEFFVVEDTHLSNNKKQIEKVNVNDQTRTIAEETVSTTGHNDLKIKVIGNNDINIDKLKVKTTQTQEGAIVAQEERYLADIPTKVTNINDYSINETPDVIKTTSGQIAVKTDQQVLLDDRRELNGDDKNEFFVVSENPVIKRTQKKITPIDNISKPFYTIQILALKDAPTDPNFFDNIDEAGEISCTDGYKRYVVGKYDTYDEAKTDIARVKQLSPKYKNAFVVNAKDYDISKTDFRSDFVDPSSVVSTNHPSEDSYDIIDTDVKHTSINKEEHVAKSTSKYDPNKTYTIQVTASRYPFYISELKEFKDVYEFYMPDKVFRYTVGKYDGAEVLKEIRKVNSFGYTEAFAVEWNKYFPYKIE